MLKFGAPVWLEPDAASALSPREQVQRLIALHQQKGYTAAYAPDIDKHDPALIAWTKEAYEKAGLVISECNYWENLMDTDPAARKKNREAMMEQLAFADELGASCTVGLTGSYCHGSVPSQHFAKNFSRDAFDEAVDLTRDILDTVRPKTTFFCYEVYQFGIVDSIEALDRLWKAVDRRQFGIHLDMVNLINCPRLYFDNAALCREALRVLGDRVVSCHAKDVLLTNDTRGKNEPQPDNITVIFNEVPMGQGGFDWHTGLQALNSLPGTVPVMLEHLPSEQAFDEAALVLRRTAAEIGIQL